MRNLERYVPRCRIFLLDGRKFRTNLLAVFFDIPLRRETATKTALLAELLKRGCEPYPSPQALAKRAEEMYGALWDVSVVKKGSRQLLLFSLETLKAVDLEESLNFLRDLILRPLAEQGAFPAEMVERQKKILRRKLRNLQDDKREYARRRALEETAAGTPWAVSADGYEEDLDGIDGKSLYEYYCKLLREESVKVFFCGDSEERRKVLALRKCFPGRAALLDGYEEAEERKAPPHFIRERKDGEQTRLVLGFGAEDMDSGRGRAAFLLMNRLLGGGPDSCLLVIGSLPVIGRIFRICHEFFCSICFLCNVSFISGSLCISEHLCCQDVFISNYRNFSRILSGIDCHWYCNTCHSKSGCSYSS